MGSALSVRELLERRCADYGMTTQEASLAAGLPKNAIYRIICGERTELWSRTRAAICRALDISPEVLDEAIIVSMDEDSTGSG